ncbi:MAG TPA: LacI family DNA-binding transcriptional regulator [Sphingobium sp.]
MVKIVDVARHAGVSTATVSRVLNRNMRVAGDLRERVERAVADLGYSMNVAARSLRTQRSSKILISVPDISNPFFADVIRGAEEAARRAGFSVMLGDTGNDPALEGHYASLLARREVDGLVILGHRVPSTIIDLLARNDPAMVPVAHGCEYSPDLRVPSVHIDNVAAGGDAARHLLELGHRRIGVVTGPLDSPLSRDRLAGVRSAIEKARQGELLLREGDFSIEAGYAHGQALALEGVTAIFCFSDEMALGALRALGDAGLRCPDDVSVIGFDDIRFAAFAQPRLTTIAQPREAIGRRTVELLVHRLEGGTGDLGHIALPHQLIVRASTGPCPTPAR